MAFNLKIISGITFVVLMWPSGMFILLIFILIFINNPHLNLFQKGYVYKKSQKKQKKNNNSNNADLLTYDHE